MTTAEISKPKVGRPKGAKTQSLPVQNVFLSQCPACLSTDRLGYSSVKTREFSGTAPTGQPFNYVSRKRTRCRKCGQKRIDVTYENVI
ncbi:hypothetical protein GmarT_13710 [Gimesia maris]|uniref:Uncharacterized protein n=1 Tax=Gimesia maris TaxID=122 RepID=A0ABX5YIK7_9PLAN|nr:hypothetical protein GmarT_13710 [Gimesia maris]